MKISIRKPKGIFLSILWAVVAILSASYCVKVCVAAPHYFYPHTLVQKNGWLSPDLTSLLKVLNIPLKGKNLLEINKVLQERYGLKKGQERWQMEKKGEDKKSFLLPIFDKLGMVHEILPRLKNYNTIIILGASVGRIRKRVSFLQKLWKSGIRAEHIVFFVGERRLVQDLEEEKNPLDEGSSSVPFRSGWVPPHISPQTEAEVAPIIWDQIITDEKLREMPIFFISAPFIKDSKTQEMRRPNTGDVVKTWLNTYDPTPGAYLAISNNPYIYYQDQAIRNVLKSENLLNRIHLETVGSAAEEDISMISYLEVIASWFRVELKEMGYLDV